MPDKTGRQTPQERVFVEAYARTGDKDYAGFKAGYAHPAQAAHNVLARPANVEAVVKAQIARLKNDALPVAVDTLLTVMQDPRAPAGARVNAANSVIKNVIGDAGAAEGKGLADATAEDLKAMQEALQYRLAELERPAIDLVAEPDTGVFA